MPSPHFLTTKTRGEGLKKHPIPNLQTATWLCLLPDATVVISSISCTFLSFKWSRPLGTASAPVHSYPCHGLSPRWALRGSHHTAVCCVRRIALDKGTDQLWGPGDMLGLREPSLGRVRPQSGVQGRCALGFAFIVCDRRRSAVLLPGLGGNETRQQRRLKLAERGWVLCAGLKHCLPTSASHSGAPNAAAPGLGAPSLSLALLRQVLHSLCPVCSVGLSIIIKSPVIPGC